MIHWTKKNNIKHIELSSEGFGKTTWNCYTVKQGVNYLDGQAVWNYEGLGSNGLIIGQGRSVFDAMQQCEEDHSRDGPTRLTMQKNKGDVLRDLIGDGFSEDPYKDIVKPSKEREAE